MRETRPGLVLAICCTALFVTTMDVSVVNVVLPRVQADLGGTVSQLQWVVDGYLLVIASLLIFAGAVADRVGRKPVFLIGLVVFGTGSALCGAAGSMELLVAARVLQAVGGAMLNPVALAIITGAYPDARGRARAIGLWSAVSGLGMAAGAPLGGLIEAMLGWRGVFLINVPIAIVALVLTWWLVPDSRSAAPRRLDPVGQILLVALVGGLVFALIEGPVLGWRSPAVVVAGVSFVLLLAVFVRVERRHASPLVDPKLFRSRRFSAAIGAAIAGFAALGGMLFALSLTLQDAHGRSTLDTGLLMLPIGLAAVVASPLSGRMVGAGRARLALLLSGCLLLLGAAGIGAALNLTEDLHVGGLLVGCVVFGLGFGTLNPPVTATAIAGLPGDRTAVAGAIASTSRQLGQAVGVALSGSLMTIGGAGLRHGIGVWLLPAGAAILVILLGVLAGARTRDDGSGSPTAVVPSAVTVA